MTNRGFAPGLSSADQAIVFVVSANLVPVHGIALQNAQGPVVPSNSNGDPVADALEAQSRQVGILQPELIGTPSSLPYFRRQPLKRVAEAASCVRIHLVLCFRRWRNIG